MSGIRRRLAKLESNRPQESGDQDQGDPTVSKPGDYRPFWEMRIEWTALHLLRGAEPPHTVDKAGAFWTLDGRFGVSPRHMSLANLQGPRTRALEDAIPPERWSQFLANYEEAQDLLERLLELAEAAAVPDDYEPPFKRAWPFALFVDDEEKEKARALTWTLIHNPDAWAMLSEITRRRDEFFKGEGISVERTM